MKKSVHIRKLKVRTDQEWIWPTCRSKPNIYEDKTQDEQTQLGQFMFGNRLGSPRAPSDAPWIFVTKNPHWASPVENAMENTVEIVLKPGGNTGENETENEVEKILLKLIATPVDLQWDGIFPGHTPKTFTRSVLAPKKMMCTVFCRRAGCC